MINALAFTFELVLTLAFWQPALDLPEASTEIPRDAVEKRRPMRRTGGMVEQSTYTLDGKVVGIRRYYTGDRLAEERPMRDGKLHGVWRQYYENGRLFAERPFRDGVMDGTFRFWDREGNLLGESVMTNGTGTLREYENLQVSSHNRERPYVDGKIHGTAVHWGPFEGSRGIGIDLVPYVQGKCHGWEYVEDEDGTILGWAYWKDGKLHGASRRRDHEGKDLMGYPHYYMNGTEVSEVQIRDAASKDPKLHALLDHVPPAIEYRKP